MGTLWAKVNRRHALTLGSGLVASLAGASTYAGRVQAQTSLNGAGLRPQDSPPGAPGSLDRKGIEAAFGITGRIQEGGVLQVDFPRTDIKAAVRGLPVMADLALDSEALFMPVKHGAMMMGELALLEQEVNPVVDRLFQEGLRISAVHNHLFTTPPVLFVHYVGHGDGVRLAQGLRRALAVPWPSPGHPLAASSPMLRSTSSPSTPSGSSRSSGRAARRVVACSW